MSDALKKAKTTSEWSFQAAPSGPFEGGETLSIDWVMRRAELAALIAIAERMDHKPHFIQIGGRSFCPDQIIGVTDLQDCVLVHMRHEVGFTFLEEDGKRTAFLNWWNKYADIEVAQ